MGLGWKRSDATLQSGHSVQLVNLSIQYIALRAGTPLVELVFIQPINVQADRSTHSPFYFVHAK
jgi:hypothetical protein